MRQLFTLRFLAAIAALAGLTLLANGVLTGDETLDAVIEPEVPDRRIDLVAPVFSIEKSDDFGIGDDGRTVGFVDLVLDEARVMRVAPGTLGEIECSDFEMRLVNRCAVLADLLGEAVIWFALLPQADDSTVELPAVVDLEDGLAQFENGWQLPFPPVIERQCRDEDIPTFSDFLRRFGENSISTVDLETGEVVAVRCAGEAAPDLSPTTTTIASVPEGSPTDAPTDGGLIEGGEVDEDLLDGPEQAPTSAP